MHSSIPNNAHVMIIGAMKCGTSSLYDYMLGHPQICSCKTKEPEYFSRNQSHGAAKGKYSDLFVFDPSIHKFTLEASTGYSKYPLEKDVCKDIFEYGLSPKFIYILRNPIERIESHFNYMQKDKRWSLDITDNHVINVSNYHLQLSQYTKYFNKKDILLLDFDELKNSPCTVLNKIYAFLDIEQSYFPETYDVKNPTKQMSSLEKNLKHSKTGNILKRLPGPLKSFLRKTYNTLLPSEKQQLTLNEKEFIHQELASSMKALERDYDFDVSKWGF